VYEDATLSASSEFENNICRNSNTSVPTSTIGLHGTPFPEKNINENTVPVRSRNTIPLIKLVTKLVSYHQGRRSMAKIGGQIHFSTSIISIFRPLPSPPLEIELLKCSQGVRGSAVSFPNGVWGGALAEIEFCTFLPPKI